MRDGNDRWLYWIMIAVIWVIVIVCLILIG